MPAQSSERMKQGEARRVKRARDTNATHAHVRKARRIMETRDIPEQEWIEYFDRFSRDHAGWPVTIEVLDPDSGPQNVAEGLPLAGISFDKTGSRPCVIQISAGDPSGRHVNHVIDLPLHIREADETGAPDGRVDVQIEPARGPTTLLHLRGPVQ